MVKASSVECRTTSTERIRIFPLPLRLRLAIDEGRIQQELDIRFEKYLFIEKKIPLGIRAMRIADRVLEPEFLDQAGFTSAGTGAVAIGADDMHFDFA